MRREGFTFIIEKDMVENYNMSTILYYRYGDIISLMTIFNLKVRIYDFIGI